MKKTWSTRAETATGIAHIGLHSTGTGIIGVAQLTGRPAHQGLASLLDLAAILSANLALMNLLPIPILDGGALLLCLAEMALRRPLPEAIETSALRIVLLTLGTMFALTTIHDLAATGLLHWIAQL